MRKILILKVYSKVCWSEWKRWTKQQSCRILTFKKLHPNNERHFHVSNHLIDTHIDLLKVTPYKHPYRNTHPKNRELITKHIQWTQFIYFFFCVRARSKSHLPPTHTHTNNSPFSPTKGSDQVNTSIKLGSQYGWGEQLNCLIFITLFSYFNTAACP